MMSSLSLLGELPSAPYSCHIHGALSHQHHAHAVAHSAAELSLTQLILVGPLLCWLSILLL